ncbi:DTW domain-containing protein [Shewanella alkalitolerans]|uniref:DTW domain-containing protein n=1 Tax=Shewanella alkalitolerans TaxID=2864209 RepID=UPI001C65E0F5|nr:tRNA-uridine aminocarboxypropyltransferase [Shewanella alkalitolerans]QYJ96050.1 DTW domain-containing protein [Shewanella alkalitolerans]
MKFVLLTHEREYDRPSNTGQLALAAFPELCRRVPWSRIAPDEALKQACESGEALLLFPKERDTDETDSGSRMGSSVNQVSTPEQLLAKIDEEQGMRQVIILDATWQEARKMMRQSPYLQAAKRLTLQESEPSRYRLRRNQLSQGLCTIECIISLMHSLGMSQEAQQLDEAFDLFMLDHRQVDA